MSESRADQIKKQYLKYHRMHPVVWDLFKKFTFEAIKAGHKHYSADAIVHRVRWETAVTLAEKGDFKINNNFVTYYARRFMRENPQHRGFFRTRVRTSAKRSGK